MGDTEPLASGDAVGGGEPDAESETDGEADAEAEAPPRGEAVAGAVADGSSREELGEPLAEGCAGEAVGGAEALPLPLAPAVGDVDLHEVVEGDAPPRWLGESCGLRVASAEADAQALTLGERALLGEMRGEPVPAPVAVTGARLAVTPLVEESALEAVATELVAHALPVALLERPPLEEPVALPAPLAEAAPVALAQ